MHTKLESKQTALSDVFENDILEDIHDSYEAFEETFLEANFLQFYEEYKQFMVEVHAGMYSDEDAIMRFKQFVKTFSMLHEKLQQGEQETDINQIVGGGDTVGSWTPPMDGRLTIDVYGNLAYMTDEAIAHSSDHIRWVVPKGAEPANWIKLAAYVNEGFGPETLPDAFYGLILDEDTDHNKIVDVNPQESLDDYFMVFASYEQAEQVLDLMDNPSKEVSVPGWDNNKSLDHLIIKNEPSKFKVEYKADWTGYIPNNSFSDSVKAGWNNNPAAEVPAASKSNSTYLHVDAYGNVLSSDTPDIELIDNYPIYSEAPGSLTTPKWISDYALISLTKKVKPNDHKDTIVYGVSPVGIEVLTIEAFKSMVANHKYDVHMVCKDLVDAQRIYGLYVKENNIEGPFYSLDKFGNVHESSNMPSNVSMKGRTLISIEGHPSIAANATNPVWNGDNKEVFFIDTDYLKVNQTTVDKYGEHQSKVLMTFASFKAASNAQASIYSDIQDTIEDTSDQAGPTLTESSDDWWSNVKVGLYDTPDTTPDTNSSEVDDNF